MPEDRELAKNLANFIKFLQKENNRQDIPDVATIQRLYHQQWGTLLTTEDIRAALHIAKRDGMLKPE